MLAAHYLHHWNRRVEERSAGIVSEAFLGTLELFLAHHMGCYLLVFVVVEYEHEEGRQEHTDGAVS